MASLKQLKNLQAQPSLFNEDSMPILDAVSDEDAYEAPDELSNSEPAVDWYIPKKSWAQFFAEREGGKREGGWDIPAFDRELPKEIRLNGWTYISDVQSFVSSHVEIVNKYNGNARFKQYLERLNQLNVLISNAS